MYFRFFLLEVENSLCKTAGSDTVLLKTHFITIRFTDYRLRTRLQTSKMSCFKLKTVTNILKCSSVLQFISATVAHVFAVCKQSFIQNMHPDLLAYISLFKMPRLATYNCGINCVSFRSKANRLRCVLHYCCATNGLKNAFSHWILWRNESSCIWKDFMICKVLT